jgi:endonuclease-8
MGGQVDWDEIVRRAAVSNSATAADLLLDQTVMAGMGNVYKSEVLFIERIHPDTPVAALTQDNVRALATRGRRLLLPNGGNRPRTTTGERRPGRRSWVYGRSGRPCRRCGTVIRTATHGELDRVTYWCPTCQPPGDQP